MTDPDVFKSMREWNDAGRVVKKGAKAYDSNFFTIEQTVPFNLFYISKRNGKFRTGKRRNKRRPSFNKF